MCSLLDQRGVPCGHRPCPGWTRGQRTFSDTTLHLKVSGIVSLYRDTKAGYRTGRFCGLESLTPSVWKSSHDHKAPCFLGWFGAVKNYSLQYSFFFFFWLIILTGNKSGNVSLTISHPLSTPVSTGLAFPHSTITRAGIVEPQSGPQLERAPVHPRGLQGQTDRLHNLGLHCMFAQADPPNFLSFQIETLPIAFGWFDTVLP